MRLQDWGSFGLDMSTPSNEACKMYDRALTQVKTKLFGISSFINNSLSCNTESRYRILKVESRNLH